MSWNPNRPGTPAWGGTVGQEDTFAPVSPVSPAWGLSGRITTGPFDAAIFDPAIFDTGANTWTPVTPPPPAWS
jgi:hypothetical protein